MKSLKFFVSLVAGAALLASCALIPPIPIGPNALGIEGQKFTVPMSPEGSAMSLQTATGLQTISTSFQDVDQSPPIPPRSFQMNQGFAESVTVTSTNLPQSIVITDDSKLVVTVSENSDADKSVTVDVPFGPLTLKKDPTCSDTTTCTYTFEDASAAGSALAKTISGSDLKLLIEIVNSGGENTIELVLTVATESAPDISGSLLLTVDVEENYIRF